MKWSAVDILYLQNNYSIETKDKIIQNLPLRSWKQIINKAHVIGVTRNDRYEDCRKSNAKKMMNLTYETLYWVGFLLADGHFTQNGRINLEISVKDIQHLKMYSEYVGCELRFISNKVSVRFYDKNVSSFLRSKFSICNNKTTHPADTSFLTEEELGCLFIGFFDGDGHISKKSGSGELTIHKAWLNTLTQWCDNLKLENLKAFQ